jgi:hypothetical protein
MDKSSDKLPERLQEDEQAICRYPMEAAAGGDNNKQCEIKCGYPPVTVFFLNTITHDI